MTDIELENFLKEVNQIDKKVLEYTTIINNITYQINNLGHSSEIFANSVETSAKLANGTFNLINEVNEGIDNTVKDYERSNELKSKTTNILGTLGILASVGSLILGGVSAIHSSIDSAKKRKEYLEKITLVKQGLKELAKEKIDSVDESIAYIKSCIPKFNEALKDICSVVYPFEKSNRRTQTQLNIKRIFDVYVKIHFLYAKLNIYKSVLNSILNDNFNITSLDVSGKIIIEKVLNVLYEFSEPDKYINNNSCYYINGISEGTLFCLSNEQYTSNHKKWDDILNKLKTIYSKETFKTHSLFKRNDADYKRIQYNNIYLKDILNVDSIYKQNVKEKKIRAISIVIIGIITILSILYFHQIIHGIPVVWHTILQPALPLFWHIILWLVMIFWKITKWVFVGWLVGPFSILKIIIHIILIVMYLIFVFFIMPFFIAIISSKEDSK